MNKEIKNYEVLSSHKSKLRAVVEIGGGRFATLEQFQATHIAIYDKMGQVVKFKALEIGGAIIDRKIWLRYSDNFIYVVICVRRMCKLDILKVWKFDDNLQVIDVYHHEYAEPSSVGGVEVADDNLYVIFTQEAGNHSLMTSLMLLKRNSCQRISVMLHKDIKSYGTYIKYVDGHLLVTTVSFNADGGPIVSRNTRYTKSLILCDNFYSTRDPRQMIDIVRCYQDNQIYREINSVRYHRLVNIFSNKKNLITHRFSGKININPVNSVTDCLLMAFNKDPQSIVASYYGNDLIWAYDIEIKSENNIIPRLITSTNQLIVSTGYEWHIIKLSVGSVQNADKPAIVGIEDYAESLKPMDLDVPNEIDDMEARLELIRSQVYRIDSMIEDNDNAIARYAKEITHDDTATHTGPFDNFNQWFAFGLCQYQPKNTLYIEFYNNAVSIARRLMQHKSKLISFMEELTSDDSQPDKREECEESAQKPKYSPDTHIYRGRVNPTDGRLDPNATDTIRPDGPKFANCPPIGGKMIVPKEVLG